MWFIHLSSLLRTTWLYFWTAVGQTFTGALLGLVVAGIVTIGTVQHAVPDRDWKTMLRRWRAEKSFATRLLLKAIVLIYAPFAAFKLIQVVYDDHVELVNRSHLAEHTIQNNKAGFIAAVTTCQQSLTEAQGFARQKATLADSLQQGILSLQGPQAQQAANITSCINNLSKLNPVIHEKISVIEIPLGSINLKNEFVGSNTLVKKNLIEAFIITNEPEHSFRGDLKCVNNFQIIENPTIQPYAQIVMMGSSAPRPIASNEYEIAVEVTGTEWNPSHPAYLKALTLSDHLGDCKFTPEG